MPRPILLMGRYTLDGEGVRVPDMPASVTTWEQASSVLDTAPVGPTRRFLVVAHEYDGPALQAWAGQAGHRAAPLPQDMDVLRGIMRHPERAKHVPAGRLYRRRLRRIVRLAIMRRRALDAAPALLPFLGTVGLAEACRRAGVDLEGVALAVTAGTTLIQDAWSGADNSDLEGRTADTVDPGGVFATRAGANGWEVFSGDTTMRNDGASAMNRDAAYNSSMSAIGDQFSETKNMDSLQSRVGVRLNGPGNGYFARPYQGDLYRMDSYGYTLLGSGASATGNKAVRIEVVGTGLSSFIGTPGSWLTGSAWNTATDSTYATGVPGFANNTLSGPPFFDEWRGGSIGAAAGGGGFGGSLRGGRTSAIFDLRRGRSGR